MEEREWGRGRGQRPYHFEAQERGGEGFEAIGSCGGKVKARTDDLVEVGGLHGGYAICQGQ